MCWQDGVSLRRHRNLSSTPRLAPPAAPDDAAPVADAEPPESPGFEATLLHEFRNERVSLIRWGPRTLWPPHDHEGGEEIFVIKGRIEMTLPNQKITLTPGDCTLANSQSSWKHAPHHSWLEKLRTRSSQKFSATPGK